MNLLTLIRSLLGAVVESLVGPPPPAPPDRIPFAIGALDRALDGGVQAGALTVIDGAPGAGKTTLAHALLRAATAKGRTAGLIINVDEIAPSLPGLVVARAGPDESSSVAATLLAARALDLLVVDGTASRGASRPVALAPLVGAAIDGGTALLVVDGGAREADRQARRALARATLTVVGDGDACSVRVTPKDGDSVVVKLRRAA
jgi:hypothetical protein